jgi:cellulase/cellobiase CelA1
MQQFAYKEADSGRVIIDVGKGRDVGFILEEEEQTFGADERVEINNQHNIITQINNQKDGDFVDKCLVFCNVEVYYKNRGAGVSHLNTVFSAIKETIDLIR